MNKQRIQALYREKLIQKEDAKNDSKSIIWLTMAIIVMFLWIVFFDGQLTSDHLIRVERIQ